MKRLITFLIGIMIVGALSAQNKADFTKVVNAKGGIVIGPTATANKATITSATLSGTLVSLYNGATQYSVAVAAADQFDISLYYSKLAPDTIQKTAAFTVEAADVRKDHHVNKATFVAITLPANLTEWTIGQVMNFYQMGAGIMVFKKASGVVFISDKDSIATSRKGQAVTVKKLAASKYILIGPLTD